MAKQYRVEINIPMLEALRKGVLRNRSVCPVCKQLLSYHAEITLSQTREIVDCSNVGKEFR